jgi:serine protease Do
MAGGRVLAGWALLGVAGPAWAILPFPGGHKGAKTQPRPGYLGVVLGEVDSDEAAARHVPGLPPMKKGAHVVVVLSVDRDAPAAAAGLRPQDVLLEINNKRVETPPDVQHELKRTNAGATVLIRLDRAGVVETVPVCLGDEDAIARRAEQQLGGPPLPAAEAPAEAVEMAPAPAGGRPASGHGFPFLGSFSPSATFTGLELDPLSTQLAEYFGVHDGAGLLVRTVSNGSPGAVAGLHAGDVILRVNKEPVVSRMDWLKQVHANRGRPVELEIMRNHREQTVTMTPGAGGKG